MYGLDSKEKAPISSHCALQPSYAAGFLNRVRAPAASPLLDLSLAARLSAWWTLGSRTMGQRFYLNVVLEPIVPHFGYN